MRCPIVSVTQSSNTTSSMGWLTLNVLLSFAQFEREVIGERVRDKIAASKCKGSGSEGRSRSATGVSTGSFWWCRKRLEQSGRSSSAILTEDPPYNVPTDGNVCGLGCVRRREFAMAPGEMTEDDFTLFLRKLGTLRPAARPTSRQRWRRTADNRYRFRGSHCRQSFRQRHLARTEQVGRGAVIPAKADRTTPIADDIKSRNAR